MKEASLNLWRDFIYFSFSMGDMNIQNVLYVQGMTLSAPSSLREHSHTRKMAATFTSKTKRLAEE